MSDIVKSIEMGLCDNQMSHNLEMDAPSDMALKTDMANASQHQHGSSEMGEVDDGEGGALSETERATQELVQTDPYPYPYFSPKFYEVTMKRANDCEDEVRKLRRMHDCFIFNLRNFNSIMDLPPPLRSGVLRAEGVAHPSNLLKDVVIALEQSGQTCADLLNSIHELLNDIHGLSFANIKAELDLVGDELKKEQERNRDLEADLEAAQNIVKEHSLVQIHERMEHLKDENRGLTDKLAQLSLANNERAGRSAGCPVFCSRNGDMHTPYSTGWLGRPSQISSQAATNEKNRAVMDWIASNQAH